MPSRRHGYQRVNYRDCRNDKPSASQFSINEEMRDFADCDENESDFVEISGEKADELTDINIKYDDFDTIDWTRDKQQDRVRIRIMKKLKKGTALERLWEAHDAWSGWLVVLMVGVSCGFFAGVIGIGADWMFDLKEGVCVSQVWLNKESCCWAANTSFLDHSGCSQWKKWSDVFEATSSAGSYVSNYFIFTLSGLLFASLCVTLVHTFAPYACGSGIPEIKTMLGGFIIHGYFGMWTLIVKSLGMMLAVAAGLSLGKEGPLVHVACCCGNVFAKIFPKYRKNEAKKREVLSAAAAAGVSVAFGAPIGGVLFSLEEVSYYFPMKTLWRSFFCAMVAAVTLKYMNPYGTGKLVLFYVEHRTPWKLFELVPFAMLGVFGGLFGAIFNKLNIWWCRLRKTTVLGKYPTTEVMVVTLITALLAYPNPFTRQNTSLLIKELFQQCEPEDLGNLCDYKLNATINVNSPQYPAAEAGPGVIKSIWLLLLAMLFKAVITIFTFGVKVPAGLFIPTMAVGACIGRITGIGMEQLVLNHQDFTIFGKACSNTVGACVQPGLYAMVGAAAALGGVTRMTVSLVVIMFELTGGLFYIVPMMLAVVMSKWVADAFGKGGIYDGHIELNMYPFLDNKEEFAYISTAEDVAKPRKYERAISCATKDSSTIEQLEILLEETSFKGFPVVDDMECMQLYGYVRRKELRLALETARSKNPELVSLSIGYFTKHAPRTEASHPPPVSLRPTLDESPLQVTCTTPMEVVVEMFRKLGLRQVLVTKDGRVTGIITKKDVIKHVQVMDKKIPDVVRYGAL